MDADSSSTRGPQSRVFFIAEMNTTQIRRLDREKTAVLLPGGILEQHGPYLPAFTDGFWNEQLTRDLAQAITTRPGWSAVIFPTIPLGNSGANDIGAHFSFPGTYAVRFETLRAIFMDLADELGKQGFRWVFVIHGHGAPNHNRALDQAGDYFRATYGGQMVNLTGLLPVVAAWDGLKSTAERAEDGLAIHAGMDETSMMLNLKPELVDSNYAAARPYAGDSMEKLIDIARSAEWPGYFGSPRLARPAPAANGWQEAAHRAIKLALDILGGADETAIVRFADEMAGSEADTLLDRASLAHEEEIKRGQRRWLKSQGLL